MENGSVCVCALRYSIVSTLVCVTKTTTVQHLRVRTMCCVAACHRASANTAAAVSDDNDDDLSEATLCHVLCVHLGHAFTRNVGRSCVHG